MRYTLFNNKHHTTITERRIKKLNDIGFAWYRDEEDSARLEKKAKDANFKWCYRNFLNNGYGSFREVIAAVKEAKEEHDRTGRPTVARYDSYHLIGKEPNGTIFLLDQSTLEKHEEKGNRVIAFGFQ